jgi:hypothetical protein
MIPRKMGFAGVHWFQVSRSREATCRSCVRLSSKRRVGHLVFIVLVASVSDREGLRETARLCHVLVGDRVDGVAETEGGG